MCDCTTCQRNARYQELLDSPELSEPMKAVLNDLVEEMVHAALDRDYYKAILDGTWPNADALIQSYRKRNAKITHSTSA